MNLINDICHDLAKTGIISLDIRCKSCPGIVQVHHLSRFYEETGEISLYMNTHPSYQVMMNWQEKHPGCRAFMIRITGLVQGVGFRPHVYRAAFHNAVEGWVNNTVNGVCIKAIGESSRLAAFIGDVVSNAPPAAEIRDMKISPARKNGEQGFVIRPSNESEQGVTEISPDIAVCPDCLHDMEAQPHRIGYPLVNCTNCGPRFSIIKDIPYDRQKTSMDAFIMCGRCAAEYHNINDRRFHAQPVACHHCGPGYSLWLPDGRQINCDNLPEETAGWIDGGGIIALKGTGGYQLVCDASNHEAVHLLRSRKQREGKPFAVMFSSPEAVSAFSSPTKSEAAMLSSWIRPVVLLKSTGKLPPEVNAGLNTIGAILPYMPFHYLLFKHLKTRAIIFTSANLSQQPIITKRLSLTEKLARVFDYAVDYNRDICNRTDDSVVQFIGKRPQIIRRSRGYAPRPVYTGLYTEGIFATGGELKNCFCMGKDERAIMSQHIGDLKNLETYDSFCESVEKAKRMFRFQPELIATDLHPDFMTSAWSRAQGLPIEYVQHHHAHIASCMAENRLHETVIGLGFDGTGFGTDGCIWGSELMVCNLDRFERIGHFEYLPMPGGDKATEEPWRMALAAVYQLFGTHIPDDWLALLPDIDQKVVDTVLLALENNINTTMSSGIGRLFDAVASLLGLCHYSSYEAEGPMKLEACLDRRIKDCYPIGIDGHGIVSVRQLIEGIGHDRKKGIPVATISARFHNTIVEASAKMVGYARQKHGVDKVVLSGGTFQNRYLLMQLTRRLRAAGMQAYVNKQVPANDGGIALGQLAVAAARRNQGSPGRVSGHTTNKRRTIKCV